jgi:hypothetical protein
MIRQKDPHAASVEGNSIEVLTLGVATILQSFPRNGESLPTSCRKHGNEARQRSGLRMSAAQDGIEHQIE